jgi:hypothetical protein
MKRVPLKRRLEERREKGAKRFDRGRVKSPMKRRIGPMLYGKGKIHAGRRRRGDRKINFSSKFHLILRNAIPADSREIPIRINIPVATGEV